MSTGQTDSSTGKSASLSAFVFTLIPVLLVAVVYFVIFLVLRPKFLRNYAPRSFLGALRPQ